MFAKGVSLVTIKEEKDGDIAGISGGFVVGDGEDNGWCGSLRVDCSADETNVTYVGYESY